MKFITKGKDSKVDGYWVVRNGVFCFAFPLCVFIANKEPVEREKLHTANSYQANYTSEKNTFL